jgi:hypothetical protein
VEFLAGQKIYSWENFNHKYKDVVSDCWYIVISSTDQLTEQAAATSFV